MPPPALAGLLAEPDFNHEENTHDHANDGNHA
jgi:hypothetical protein